MEKIALAIVIILSALQAFAGMQEDRMGFINKLIKKGIFQKVEIPGNLPHLWVKPAFHSLDFEEKQKFVNVVYAYYVTKDKKYDMDKTGKKIGVYADAYGGLKLK